jgi:hypothetical protein
MSELLRTNDVALIAVVEGLLQEAGIGCHVADRHASVLEGTLNFLQMRVLVADEREDEARESSSPMPTSGSGCGRRLPPWVT